MLLTNRLNFFDKRGNELNMLPDAGVIATVIDPANVGGYGATFNVYTDRDGSISVLEVSIVISALAVFAVIEGLRLTVAFEKVR